MFSSIQTRLHSILPLSLTIGVLIRYIAPHFQLLYQQTIYIPAFLMFIFLCTFTAFPDTPRQLVKMNRREVIRLVVESIALKKSRVFSSCFQEAIYSIKTYHKVNCIVYDEEATYRNELKKYKIILKLSINSWKDFGECISYYSYLSNLIKIVLSFQLANLRFKFYLKLLHSSVFTLLWIGLFPFN